MAIRSERKPDSNGSSGGTLWVLCLILASTPSLRAEPPNETATATPTLTRPPRPAEFSKDPLEALTLETPDKAAPKTAASPSSAPQTDSALTNVLEKHGADREAALAQLLQELRATKDPSRAIRVGRLFAESLPSTAMAWSAEICATKEGIGVATGVAEGLSDLRGAISWADSLSSEVARAKALGVLIVRLAATSPAEASIWLRRIPKGSERDRTMIVVVTTWTAQNPTAARGWVEKNLSALDGTAIAAFAGAWAKGDSAAATKWVKGLKDAAVRNQALSAVAQASARD